MTKASLHRAQELQLLRQINRCKVQSFHSATIVVMLRLQRKGELMYWKAYHGGIQWVCGDITAKGRRALGESHGTT